jgi:hypothetical protein
MQRTQARTIWIRVNRPVFQSFGIDLLIPADGFVPSRAQNQNTISRAL